MKTKKKAAKKVAKKVAPKVEPQAEAVIPTPEPASEPLEVAVIGLAINPRYVYAGLDGNRIAIEVPIRMSQRLLHKTIKINRKLDSDTYELYHGN
jgi:hypothetical protein